MPGAGGPPSTIPGWNIVNHFCRKMFVASRYWFCDRGHRRLRGANQRREALGAGELFTSGEHMIGRILVLGLSSRRSCPLAPGDRGARSPIDQIETSPISRTTIRPQAPSVWRARATPTRTSRRPPGFGKYPGSRPARAKSTAQCQAARVPRKVEKDSPAATSRQAASSVQCSRKCRSEVRCKVADSAITVAKCITDIIIGPVTHRRAERVTISMVNAVTVIVAGRTDAFRVPCAAVACTGRWSNVRLALA